MGLHFDFSSEQRMLRESVRGLLAREQASGHASEETSAAVLGRRLADHGVFGVMTAERAGGLGLGLTDALVVAIEAGRSQVRFPVIETIATAGLLAEARPSAAEQVLNGSQIATCAMSGDVELVSGGKDLTLRGQALVPFAGAARWLTVPLRKGGGDNAGPRAVIVDLAAPGISASPAPVFDLTYPLYRVVLRGPVEPSDVIADRATPLLSVLACGELTGAAEHCFELTLRHLKEREQFGKPIGANQSLRHRAADDWIGIQGMKAASEYAAASFDAAQGPGEGTLFGADDFARAAHVAKAYCSATAREIAEHAVQVHGGIGFTWEFGLHLPLRRILRLAVSHGDAAEHRSALAGMLLNENRSTE